MDADQIIATVWPPHPPLNVVPPPLLASPLPTRVPSAGPSLVILPLSITCVAGAKSNPLTPAPHIARGYDTTSELGRERAYLRHLWANQCYETLHMNATAFLVF